MTTGDSSRLGRRMLEQRGTIGTSVSKLRCGSWATHRKSTEGYESRVIRTETLSKSMTVPPLRWSDLSRASPPHPHPDPVIGKPSHVACMGEISAECERLVPHRRRDMTQIRS